MKYFCILLCLLLLLTTKTDITYQSTSTENCTYIVGERDTFLHIAQRLSVDVSELQHLNPNIISNKLQIGQTITFKCSNVKDSGICEYKVVKEDTVWKIAQKYNTTSQLIQALNNIQDPNFIEPGQSLKVPCPSQTPTPTPIPTPTPSNIPRLLTTGEIVGIVTGAITGLAACIGIIGSLIGIVYFLLEKQKGVKPQPHKIHKPGL